MNKTELQYAGWRCLSILGLVHALGLLSEEALHHCRNRPCDTCPFNGWEWDED